MELYECEFETAVKLLLPNFPRLTRSVKIKIIFLVVNIFNQSSFLKIFEIVPNKVQQKQLFLKKESFGLSAAIENAKS